VKLTQEIKAQANRLGFELVGVTTPEPLMHADVFESWLDQGRQGEMAYLSSPRSRIYRGRPDLVLPECCSVLCLGIRYPAPIPQGSIGLSDSGLRGRIASYAWGEDYHTILAERLKSLETFIENKVGHYVPNKWYTDTGPLLERELAQRAGLGWIGKNTCLINPSRGSYFFLAEILLGIELEPDQPFTPDRCGKCTRCIDACPTNCILPDRTLDARRCISYLTIELKGSIPRELRPLVGAWVFGCDICQQVCPWNRFASQKVDPAFESHITIPDPNLLDELMLSEEEFNSKYRLSPLKRTRRGGYLRNMVVALGNLHDHETVTPLKQVMMLEPEPLVRAHAAWALGQIDTVFTSVVLENAAKIEKDLMVRSEIYASLEKREKR
jgi:epoxyqueuosine reductase